ncbi:hypothetical protein EDB81DRAFT_897228 [Dactylonectria macrodidyma]|uniref:HMA domain-containing protein n=1 Tax=Dactylonectria macrodidyma TaxID=307937 RepID=A0A9P9FUC7_9HYPO|nr:hypothetical protein EDB81DRAFT_897228 [Dactylonectria macrodidyma]
MPAVEVDMLAALQPFTSTALNRSSEAEGVAKACLKYLVIAGITGEAIPEGRRRASPAVHGMTCAVCVNANTDELGRLEGVVDAVVSLVSNSATVTFDGGNARVAQIVEAIEDLGYEATVDNVTNLGEQGIEGTVTMAMLVERLNDGEEGEEKVSVVQADLLDWVTWSVCRTADPRPVTAPSFAATAPLTSPRSLASRDRCANWLTTWSSPVNFAWAVVYNVIAIPITAGCLYPIANNGQHVRLDPVWASLAMALSGISVVTSSLALRSPIPGLGFSSQEDYG